MSWRLAASCAIPNLPASLSGDPRDQFPLSLGLVFSAAISPVPFAFQSPRSCRPSIRANTRLLPFRANGLGDGGNHSLHARNGANIPASPYGLGDSERMEHAKLANGSRHELPIGRSPSPAGQDQMDAARSAGKKAVGKKAAPRKAKPARPLRKETGSKSKSNKLVCRYCGSDDLAPSFIKRRDRRCRKCFSKRYGSAARARKRRSRSSLATT
jgi:hypothetical protein